MSVPGQTWQPTTIKRFNKAVATSADTAQVMTDQGIGYLKALGNKEGPNILACELVGTQLAKWLGLTTFEYAIIQVTDLDDIPHHNFDPKNRRPDDRAKIGSAFITKEMKGDSWSGNDKQLAGLINPEDLSRLVVFDTWTLNCDRYSLKPDGSYRKNLNNVFMSETAPKGHLRLIAMDHTHCFSCGRPLTKKIADIDRIKDNKVYGLFPEFQKYLQRNTVKQAVARLKQLKPSQVSAIIGDIPADWEMNAVARDSLQRLIVERAAHVADTIFNSLFKQHEFDFESNEEGE